MELTKESSKYFKVTRHDECHYGLTYKNGINVLEGKFNDDPNIECGPGGLYFTDKKNIHKFYNYGIYLRVVELPNDDSDFRMVKLIDKFRANKMSIKERYSLFDPKTYEMFGLNIKDNKHILDFACELLNIDLSFGIVMKLGWSIFQRAPIH